MQAVIECCCGLDVHKDVIAACIIKGDESIKIHKEFSTFQSDLQELVKWLYDNDCYHIAMESTGVYWKPIYEAIERYSTYYESIIVANARHMRNLPGRKSDVGDAEWIATLLKHGLLENSFVPDRDIRDLRELSRVYKNLVSQKTRCKNHIEKFLQNHGLKLSSVLSDITGKSGRQILELLSVKGCLTVEDVRLSLRGRTKRSAEEIQSAICGELNGTECFLLNFHLNELQSIELNIEILLEKMKEIASPYKEVTDTLTSIVGIDTVSSILILAEIGATPTQNFKSSRHLVSWAGLRPRNDESAGKIKSRKILHGNPYLKSILCQASWAAVRSRNNPFHYWFWTHQARLGRKKSIVAVSRKLLTLIYFLIQTGQLYNRDIALKPYI